MLRSCASGEASEKCQSQDERVQPRPKGDVGTAFLFKVCALTGLHEVPCAVVRRDGIGPSRGRCG